MSWTRRSFLKRTPALSAAPSSLGIALSAAKAFGGSEKPALLGGPKIRTEAFRPGLSPARRKWMP